VNFGRLVAYAVGHRPTVLLAQRAIYF